MAGVVNRTGLPAAKPVVWSAVCVISISVSGVTVTEPAGTVVAVGSSSMVTNEDRASTANDVPATRVRTLTV